MKRLSILLVIFSTINWAQSQSFDQIFVDQAWLQTHLEDNHLKILHVDRAEGFKNGHIPGAVFISAQDLISTSMDSLYVQLPAEDAFQQTLQARGITNESTIVICSGWQSFAWAYRLYVTLEYFGLENQVRILDGGIKGWTNNQLTVDSDTVIAKPADSPLQFNPNPAMLVDKVWINEHRLESDICIIDARRDAYYSGEEHGNYNRSGHIAGAENITWTTLVDENHFLIPQDSLRNMYQKAGMTHEKTLVSYCHVGLRASVIYTIGISLGYKAELYDGSYNEWDRQTDLYPVETGH